METPTSSTLPVEAAPPSELPVPSEPATSSASSPTPNTQTLHDAPLTPDRVVVRCGEQIEVITYTQEGFSMVAVEPRRAIQLANALIRYALEKTEP